MKNENAGGELLLTTLEREASAQFEEKKSVFIGHAKPVKNEEEALDFIKEKKKQYSDARHNVWAYRLRGDVTVRCSDDGEPQGSAGIPVLDAIRKSGVSDAVLVVTRYFGGILLGAGGLVRAYSHAAHLAIEQAHIVTFEQYVDFLLECSYADHPKFQSELLRAGAILEGTEFSERVVLRFSVRKAEAETVTARIREMSGGTQIPIVTGERFRHG